MTDSTLPLIILSSTSPFRKEILSKLCIPFTTASPKTDETPAINEGPEQLVMRLALAKASAVAPDYPDALIIGSDQVAYIEGEILGKPGNKKNAIKQLEKTSGKVVTFYTGLCLLNSKTGDKQVVCELFKVHFRTLSANLINRYLDTETPYGCAGSFKSEALGITLFEKLEGDDPNSLVGLPLIQLVKMFENQGLYLPL